jgi:hypothetical protein
MTSSRMTTSIYIAARIRVKFFFNNGFIYKITIDMTNLTLILTEYEYYIFFTGCEPDMFYTLMIHLQA